MQTNELKQIFAQHETVIGIIESRIADVEEIAVWYPWLAKESNDPCTPVTIQSLRKELDDELRGAGLPEKKREKELRLFEGALETSE